MNIVNGKEEGWATLVEGNLNADSYSAGTMRFTQKWVELMEKRIADGASVADCAKETSHEADTEGITGFMYGWAVNALSCYWTHGEELRQWHNIDCQIGNEGEVANEKGGVLNPAVFTIG